jgi:hypothetical protein
MSEQPVLSRAYKIWTPQEDELLKTLLEEGKGAKEIGKILGRSSGTITMRKRRLGLVRRGSTCQTCQAPITQAADGRPRLFCSDACGNAAAALKRAARIAARLAEHDWTCAAYDCTNQLPQDNIRRRYCSPRCRGRTHARVYVRLPSREKT